MDSKPHSFYTQQGRQIFSRNYPTVNTNSGVEVSMAPTLGTPGLEIGLLFGLVAEQRASLALFKNDGTPFNTMHRPDSHGIARNDGLRAGQRITQAHERLRWPIEYAIDYWTDSPDG